MTTRAKAAKATATYIFTTTTWTSTRASINLIVPGPNLAIPLTAAGKFLPCSLWRRLTLGFSHTNDDHIVVLSIMVPFCRSRRSSTGRHIVCMLTLSAKQLMRQSEALDFIRGRVVRLFFKVDGFLTFAPHFQNLQSTSQASNSLVYIQDDGRTILSGLGHSYSMESNPGRLALSRVSYRSSRTLR